MQRARDVCERCLRVYCIGVVAWFFARLFVGDCCACERGMIRLFTSVRLAVDCKYEQEDPIVTNFRILQQSVRKACIGACVSVSGVLVVGQRAEHGDPAFRLLGWCRW